MKIFDYDKATGRILRVLSYPNSYGQGAVDLVPDGIFCADGFEGDDLSHYVVDGEVVQRPIQNIILDGMVLKGVRNTATIEIEHVVYNCDGSDIELSFVRPGTYTVKVVEWPFQDWSKDIEVSA